MRKSAKKRWGKRKRQNALIKIVKKECYFPDANEMAKEFKCHIATIYRDFEDIKDKVKIDPKKLTIEIPRMLRKVMMANFKDSFGVKKTLVLTNRTKDTLKQHTEEVDDIYAMQTARRMFEKNCATSITLMQELGIIDKVADKVDVSDNRVTQDHVIDILNSAVRRKDGAPEGKTETRSDT